MGACSNDIIDVLKELLPQDVYFVVGQPNAFVEGGIVQPNQPSFTIPSFKGWQVRLIRSGFPQYLTNPGTGNIYFDYTPITGEFTLPVNTQLNEEFICMAYKPS
jgi:hypothetical protein